MPPPPPLSPFLNCSTMYITRLSYYRHISSTYSYHTLPDLSPSFLYQLQYFKANYSYESEKRMIILLLVKPYCNECKEFPLVLFQNQKSRIETDTHINAYHLPLLFFNVFLFFWPSHNQQYRWLPQFVSMSIESSICALYLYL